MFYTYIKYYPTNKSNFSLKNLLATKKEMLLSTFFLLASISCVGKKYEIYSIITVYSSESQPMPLKKGDSGATVGTCYRVKCYKGSSSPYIVLA